MRFKDIVGQESIKEVLRRGHESGRVSHALLFTGESGRGGLALALAYFQYLNCTNRQGGDSCGVCPSCRQAEALAHPDLHFVFPAPTTKESRSACDVALPAWREMVSSSGGYFSEQEWYASVGMENKQGLISKKEADEVIRKLSFKAFESEWKAVVMWLPERMNDSSANCLLKILEEPWDKTLFLLVSEHPEKLLATILSRTQEVSVGRIDREALAKAAVERFGVAPADAADAARVADGSMVTLKALFSAEAAEMRSENFSHFASLMRLAYGQKHMELMEWAEQMAKLGRERQKHFLEYSLGMLRESYMLTAGLSPISYLWGEEAAFCTKFAPFVNNSNIELLIGAFERTLRDVMANGNARIVFIHFALAASKFFLNKPNK